MADLEAYAILTSVTVAAGEWAQNHTIKQRIFVGGFLYFIGLSVFGNVNYDLTAKFALLVLLGALFNYAVPLFKGLGVSNG